MQFDYDFTVRLPRSERPVAATATIGTDSAGIPGPVKVRFHLAGRGVLDVNKGDAFARARRELLGPHYDAIRARAAEMRASVDQPISQFALQVA